MCQFYVVKIDKTGHVTFIYYTMDKIGYYAMFCLVIDFVYLPYFRVVIVGILTLTLRFEGGECDRKLFYYS